MIGKSKGNVNIAIAVTIIPKPFKTFITNFLETAVVFGFKKTCNVKTNNKK
ncbi:Uncharacterised protein [Streptococcus pneumoniae]|nr:Uncharacterised protein [Streptococcus pneumoniae]